MCRAPVRLVFVRLMRADATHQAPRECNQRRKSCHRSKHNTHSRLPSTRVPRYTPAAGPCAAGPRRRESAMPPPSCRARAGRRCWRPNARAPCDAVKLAWFSSSVALGGFRPLIAGGRAPALEARMNPRSACQCHGVIYIRIRTHTPAMGHLKHARVLEYSYISAATAAVHCVQRRFISYSSAHQLDYS